MENPYDQYVTAANKLNIVCLVYSDSQLPYPIIVMGKHDENHGQIQVSEGDHLNIEQIKNMPFLTPKQAATYLQLSPKTIWSHTRRGLLPVCRIGGLIRYRRQALDETLAKLEIRSNLRK